MEASKKENIFVVTGTAVTGDSFLGRTKQVDELTSIIFTGIGVRNIIGPTRIGKSSLINEVFEKNKNCPQRLFVKINMADCQNARDFWMSLMLKIKRSLHFC